MIYGTAEFNQLLLDMIQRDKRHDTYDQSVKKFADMKPHIYGSKPLDILRRTRPREPDEVKEYRIENYEATTKATASKAFSVLMKIFNPWFSEVRWKNQTSNGKALQDYALEYYPEHNSVIKFLSEAGMKRMIADANGVMAVRPMKKPDGELEQAKPVVIIYGSPAIWWKDLDCYVIHLKQEQTKDGVIHSFTYFDKDQVLDFSAAVVNSSNIATLVTFDYNTGFNEIPVWPLQGDIETTEEGLVYYCSFFEPALPFWNLAITHESDVFGAYITNLHPIKIEVVEDCEFVFEDQRCNMGKIAYPDGNVKTCPLCKGSGKRSVAGPYGVHQVTKDKLRDGTGTQIAPVSFATVPTEPTKMLEERVERLHIKGLEALNMDVIDNTGANQSGVAKVIDRSELYDFLYKIASVVYGTHLTNIFYFFNKYMFGVVDSNPGRDAEKNLPEINTPTKFDISSTPELTVEYKTAKDADVNAEYLRQKMIALASKEFANNPDVKRIIVMGIELDPLPGMTVDQADALLPIGVISKRDAVLHFQIGKFLNQAIDENNGFLDSQPKDKLAKLYEMADQFISDNKVTLNTSAIINANAKGNSNPN